MKKIILAIVSALTLSSCATLFNKRTHHTTIITNAPAKLVIINDTLPDAATTHYVEVTRSKEPLSITVFNDNSRKDIQVKSRKSTTYWLNSCPWPPVFLVGFFVDRKKSKRYGYPGKIYIDLNSAGSNYLTYVPLDSGRARFKNILKFTPILYVNTGIELSIERKTGKFFSTQFNFCYLLPERLDHSSIISPGIKGFKISLEEKYYLKKTALFGPYIGFETGYLNSRYTDIKTFTDDEDNHILSVAANAYTDTFGVKKHAYIFNLKLGTQVYLSRFIIDFYIGGGILAKNVTHTDRKNPDAYIHLNGPHDYFGYDDIQTGKYVTGSFPVNLRFGWIF